MREHLQTRIRECRFSDRRSPLTTAEFPETLQTLGHYGRLITTALVRGPSSNCPDGSDIETFDPPASRTRTRRCQQNQHLTCTLHLINLRCRNTAAETDDLCVISDSIPEDVQDTATPRKDWWKVYQLESEDADDTATEQPHPWDAFVDQYRAELPMHHDAKLASKKKRSREDAFVDQYRAELPMHRDAKLASKKKRSYVKSEMSVNLTRPAILNYMV